MFHFGVFFMSAAPEIKRPGLLLVMQFAQCELQQTARCGTNHGILGANWAQLENVLQFLIQGSCIF